MFVSTKIRKDILLGEHQGDISLEGKIERIYFQRYGGGVYRAYLDAI